MLIRVIAFCFEDDVSTQIALGPMLKFNGGGHINHSIFWKVLCPNGSALPSGISNCINILFSRENSFKCT
jgi:Fe-Mn family superoxide dismutase